MTNEIIFRLLDAKSFKIRINEMLPFYESLIELFSSHNLEYETWEPSEETELQIIEIGFSANCKFQDVFLVTLILKDFGINRIYPSRKDESEITIGTYLHQVKNIGKYALAEPIDIESFLLIDPKLSTQEVIETAFEHHLTEEEIDNEVEQSYYYTHDYYYDDDDDNYGSSYSKYGGYNGYDDDTIDSAFEGDPEATWNVD